MQISQGSCSASHRALTLSNTHTNGEQHVVKLQEIYNPTEGLKGEGVIKLGVTKEQLERETGSESFDWFHFARTAEQERTLD